MEYKKLIVELLDRIDDNELLELIYRFCKKLVS